MAGLAYSAVAGAAQVLYHRAKYGAARFDVDRSLACCAAANDLYSLNFYTSCYAAERSFAAGLESASTEERAAWMARSGRWCERGLRRNPYDRSLRLLRARLLEEEHGAAAAVGYLEQYVEWHFWHAGNHRVLGELYARAGDFDKAQQELFLIRDRPEFAEAEVAVQRAQEQFLAGLTGPGRAPQSSPPERDRMQR